MKKVPVLYVDLDGTVRQGKDDELGRFVNGPDDVRVFPEATEMMRRWKAAGGRIVAVTNQGGIALGHVTRENVIAALAETDRQAGNVIEVAQICPHHPAAETPEEARCGCRKPRPGMITSGELTLHGLHPDEIYPAYMALMVGDRDEDKACAHGADIDFQWAAEWRAQAGTIHS